MGGSGTDNLGMQQILRSEILLELWQTQGSDTMNTEVYVPLNTPSE